MPFAAHEREGWWAHATFGECFAVRRVTHDSCPSILSHQSVRRSWPSFRRVRAVFHAYDAFKGEGSRCSELLCASSGSGSSRRQHRRSRGSTPEASCQPSRVLKAPCLGDVSGSRRARRLALLGRLVPRGPRGPWLSGRDAARTPRTFRSRHLAGPCGGRARRVGHLEIPPARSRRGRRLNGPIRTAVQHGADGRRRSTREPAARRPAPAERNRHHAGRWPHRRIHASGVTRWGMVSRSELRVAFAFTSDGIYGDDVYLRLYSGVRVMWGF